MRKAKIVCTLGPASDTPETIEAETDPEWDSVSDKSEMFPHLAIVRYGFPARGKLPPMTLTWHHDDKMPPLPKLEKLPDRVLLVIVSVPSLWIPPPPPPASIPLLIIRSERVTVTPDWIVRMRKFGVPPAVLRMTVSTFDPGP